MSAFPPHRSTPSIPISQSLALSHLQTYLTNTQTQPYLHPNARLEVSGPTAGSTSSSITIHNLQRVEAGLRGEWLAPVLEDFNNGNANGAIEVAKEVAKGMDDGVGQEGDKMGEEGWMEAEEYARQQSVEEGEVAPTRTVVREEGDEVIADEKRMKKKRKLENGNATAVVEDVPVAKVSAGGEKSEWEKVRDKEAKKKAKKLRSKEEKKQRNAEKQAEKRGSVDS